MHKNKQSKKKSAGKVKNHQNKTEIYNKNMQTASVFKTKRAAQCWKLSFKSVDQSNMTGKIWGFSVSSVTAHSSVMEQVQLQVSLGQAGWNQRGLWELAADGRLGALMKQIRCPGVALQACRGLALHTLNNNAPQQEPAPGSAQLQNNRNLL